MAADNKTTTTPEATPAAPVASAKNPILTVLVLLNSLLMGAVAYFQYTTHQKLNQGTNFQDIIKSEMQKMQTETDEGATKTGEAKKDDGILLPLETFTANLAQGDGPRRFVRLNAVIKFSKTSSEEEFKAKMPKIRDVIINTLNSKRAEDLLKSEGKNYLKEEIKAAINTFLVEGEVTDVFYVGFQIN